MAQNRTGAPSGFVNRFGYRDGNLWELMVAPGHREGSRTLQLANQKERVMRLVQKFLADDSAATAIEYGLIAAGIAVAIIAVVQGLGTQLNTTFSSVSSALK